jgi:Secretion system C-terminal sorting domain
MIHFFVQNLARMRHTARLAFALAALLFATQMVAQTPSTAAKIMSCHTNLSGYSNAVVVGGKVHYLVGLDPQANFPGYPDAPVQFGKLVLMDEDGAVVSTIEGNSIAEGIGTSTDLSVDKNGKLCVTYRKPNGGGSYGFTGNYTTVTAGVPSASTMYANANFGIGQRAFVGNDGQVRVPSFAAAGYFVKLHVRNTSGAWTTINVSASNTQLWNLEAVLDVSDNLYIVGVNSATGALIYYQINAGITSASLVTLVPSGCSQVGNVVLDGTDLVVSYTEGLNIKMMRQNAGVWGAATTIGTIAAGEDARPYVYKNAAGVWYAAYQTATQLTVKRQATFFWTTVHTATLTRPSNTRPPSFVQKGTDTYVVYGGNNKVYLENLTTNVNPFTTTATATTICAGQTSTLTANGAGSCYTYQWKKDNTNISGATNSTYSATQAGTYRVYINNGIATLAAPDSIIVSLAQNSATITGVNAFCAGSNTTLTASGGTSYVWSNNANTAANTIATAGTYTVTATNAQGCTTTTSQTITENALPTANITGATAFCTGTNTTLIAASGGTSYAWSNNINTAANTIATAGTYTVTVTNVAGCTATTSQTVTANALPIPNITGATAFCIGANTTLTASGGTNYVWSNSINTAANAIATAGTYTVTVTNAQNCTATTNRTVTVSALPTASITGATVFCAGANTILTASGGTSYTWSNSVNTAQNTITTAGTYTVTVTSAALCTTTSSINIQLSAPVTTAQSIVLTNTNPSITVGTHTYTTAGTFTDVLASWRGCDSIVTTNVIVHGAYTIGLPTSVSCATTTGCIPIIATSTVSNVDAITVKLNLSPTITFGTPVLNNTVIPQGTAFTNTIGGQYLIGVSLGGTGTINAVAGDTIMCIPYTLVSATPSQTITLSGTLEEEYSSAAPYTAPLTSVTAQVVGSTTLAGNVRYAGDNSRPIYGTIPTTLTGTDAACTATFGTDFTDVNGNFNIANATGALALKIDRESTAAAGFPVIGSQDAYLTQRAAVLDATQFSIYNFLTMDTNGDGRISPLDATNIQRRAVGILPSFNGKHWVFFNTGLLQTTDFLRSATYPLDDGIGFSANRVPSTMVRNCQNLNTVIGSSCTPLAPLQIDALLLGDADLSWQIADATSFKGNMVNIITLDLVNAVRDASTNTFTVPVYSNSQTTGIDLRMQNMAAIPNIDTENFPVGDTNMSVISNRIGGAFFVSAAALVANGVSNTCPIFVLKVQANQGITVLTPSMLGNITSYLNGALASVSFNAPVNACFTNIESQDIANTINISPNPSNGAFVLNTNNLENASLKITNALGQIIVEQKINNATTQLDLSAQVSGIYFVEITSKQGKTVKKIVVQK